MLIWLNKDLLTSLKGSRGKWSLRQFAGRHCARHALTPALRTAFSPRTLLLLRAQPLITFPATYSYFLTLLGGQFSVPTAPVRRSHTCVFPRIKLPPYALRWKVNCLEVWNCQLSRTRYAGCFCIFRIVAEEGVIEDALMAFDGNRPMCSVFSPFRLGGHWKLFSIVLFKVIATSQ